MPSLVRLRVPIGFAAGIAYLALARPSAVALAGALPLVAAGLGIRLWAAGTIAKNRLLTTWGPYAHVRHPLYLGSALLVLGFALAGGSPALAAALVSGFALVYVPVLRREEASLGASFGAPFDAWREAVPAIVPRLSPYRDGAPAIPFSWAEVRRHREYRAVAGALLALALLWVRR